MEAVIYEKIKTEYGVMELEHVLIEQSRKRNIGYDVVAVYMNIMEDYEIKYHFHSMAQIAQAIERGQLVYR